MLYALFGSRFNTPHYYSALNYSHAIPCFVCNLSWFILFFQPFHILIALRLTWFPYRQTKGRCGRPEREVILNPSVICSEDSLPPPRDFNDVSCWDHAGGLLVTGGFTRLCYVDGSIPRYPMSYPLVILTPNPHLFPRCSGRNRTGFPTGD